MSTSNGDYWGLRAQQAIQQYAQLMRPLVEKLQCGWCGHTYAEHPKTESHEKCDGEVSDAERDETGSFCQCPGFASVREVKEITAMSIEPPARYLEEVCACGHSAEMHAVGLVKYAPYSCKFGVVNSPVPPCGCQRFVNAEKCQKCGHSWASHSAFVACRHRINPGELPYRTCGCKMQIPVTTAEQSESYEQQLRCYEEQCPCPGDCERRGRKPTRAAQSESYSRSAQSEPSPQYEERQSSSHFQCKFQHARTAVDQLVRRANTSGSNHPAELARWRGQFSHTLLALSKCEATECQVLHRLVEQVLSNLRLE